MLQTKELTKTKLSNPQVFEVLRSKKIFRLGKVERMYLEACGIYSIYEYDEIKAGLPLYPTTDKNIYEGLQDAASHEKACIATLINKILGPIPIVSKAFYAHQRDIIAPSTSTV